MNSIDEFKQLEYEFLKNKINLEGCGGLSELIEKYLTQLLGTDNSLRELRKLNIKT